MLDPKTLEEGKLLKKDSKAICQFCMGDLGMNKFLLQGLMSTGRILRPEQKKENTVACKECGNDVKPIVKGDLAVCEKCGKDLKLNKFMINALKMIKGKGSVELA